MIALKQLGKIYGEGTAYPVTALSDINLEIAQGEMVSIMGPSGSGKSTLLNLIGLLDRQTGGTYCLNGQPVGMLGMHRRAALRNRMFGFVLQDFAVLDQYTVYQNVKIPLSYAKQKCESPRQHITALLETLQIADKIDTPTRYLSGGQRQRVAIARALVNNPEVILADEPTGALDQKTGKEVLALFHSIHQQGKTVVIVTHDPQVAAQCGKIVYLLDGKIERVEAVAQDPL